MPTPIQLGYRLYKAAADAAGKPIGPIKPMAGFNSGANGKPNIPTPPNTTTPQPRLVYNKLPGQSDNKSQLFS